MIFFNLPKSIIVFFLFSIMVSSVDACETQDAAGNWKDYNSNMKHAEEPCYFNKGGINIILQQISTSNRVSRGGVKYKTYSYQLNIIKNKKTYTLDQYAQNDEIGINGIEIDDLGNNTYRISLFYSSKDILQNNWNYTVSIYIYNSKTNSILYKQNIVDTTTPNIDRSSHLPQTIEYGIDSQSYNPKNKTYTYIGRIYNKKDGYNAKSATPFNYAFQLTNNDIGMKCLYQKIGKIIDKDCNDWTSQKLEENPSPVKSK